MDGSLTHNRYQCKTTRVGTSEKKLGHWVDEWMDGWMGAKAGLRIAYSKSNILFGVKIKLY